MSDAATEKFRVVIVPDECKGCLRCVNACPRKVIAPTNSVNMMGVTYVEYLGAGCVGCGACYYACPEPGAITVYERED